MILVPKIKSIEMIINFSYFYASKFLHKICNLSLVINCLIQCKSVA
jgi:hypothetical protein